MKIMQAVRPALILLLGLSLLTGGVYPLLVTGLAQLLFPAQAAGSLLRQNNRLVGSTLIGQSFSAPGYFWSRPSATGSTPYDALASGGSNLGPLNPALQDAVKQRVAALRAADPGNDAPVPVDLVTASASGLDPHISLAAALYQVPRVARARNIATAKLQALVMRQHLGRQWGFLGEPRVNVLQLNAALDELAKPLNGGF